MRILISALPAALGLLLVALSAHAEDAPANDTSADDGPSPPPSKTVSRLSVEIPFVLQRAAAQPLGFDGDSLLEPFNLVYSLNRDVLPRHPVFVIDANASFPRYSLAPALGVTPGMAFGVKSFSFRFSGDIQDQKTVSKAPFSGSQFDTWIFSLLAQGTYRVRRELTVGIDGRYAAFLKTQIANLEGIETDIDHHDTLIVSPWIALELPWGLGVKAQLDIDDLGSTAIASKEFAVGIESQTVERLGLALTERFGDFGAELHYYYVTGFRDATELAYQAPFYYRDYLLSPQTLTLGVSWYF